MKKILCFFTAALVASSCVTVLAEQGATNGNSAVRVPGVVVPGSGKCGDDMTWTLDETGTLTISGTGIMYSYMDEYEKVAYREPFTQEMVDSGEVVLYEPSDFIPWFQKNDTHSITRVKIEDGVQGLSSQVFSQTDIEGLILPDSVTQLEPRVFTGNRKLKNVVLPDTLEALTVGFGACDSLSYIHLPANLKVIGEQSFISCLALGDIRIPDSVQEIGESAFERCLGMKSIRLPESLETIAECAFKNNDNLENVLFPPKLRVIGDEAFTQCYRLPEIILPDSVETIGTRAFSFSVTNRAVKKQTAYIPKSVKEIGDWAFNTETVLYGFKDSAAEAYAKKSGNKFIEVTESMYTAPDYDHDEPVLDVFSDGSRINVSAAGRNVKFEEAAPFIDESGRTQIPVRSVAEALNCKVDWDDAARQAALTKDGKTVVITIDSAELTVDGSTVTMDTTAQIANDRTYIPLRFVGEALGMAVNWIT